MKPSKERMAQYFYAVVRNNFKEISLDIKIKSEPRKTLPIEYECLLFKSRLIEIKCDVDMEALVRVGQLDSGDLDAFFTKRLLKYKEHEYQISELKECLSDDQLMVLKMIDFNL